MEMSFSERCNEGRGALNENGDQNILSGSHNRPNIWQQQNFGGGDLTVVQEQPPCLRKTFHIEWTPELSNCFLHAVNKLGGPFSAKPKDVIREMAIPGLTTENVKSRLQTLRRWLREGKNPDIWGSGPGMGDQNVADISAPNGYRFLGPNNNPTSSTAINNVKAGQQIHTPGFLDHNGSFYPFQPVSSDHWAQLAQYCEALGNIQQGNELARMVQQLAQYCEALGNIQQGNALARVVQQPAQNGGALGLQEQTSNGYSIPGPCNILTTSTAINNGAYYFHPGDELARVVQLAQYGVGVQEQPSGCLPAQYGASLQEQTPVLLYQNGAYYFHPGDELARVVQLAQYGVGVQEQPSSLYNPNEVFSVRAGNETHVIQQPAQDGEALGNIQQATTDTVQAQNATDMSDLLEDFEKWQSFGINFADLGIEDRMDMEPFGFA